MKKLLLTFMFISVLNAQTPKNALLLALKNHPQKDTLRCFLLNEFLNSNREETNEKPFFLEELKNVCEQNLKKKSKFKNSFTKYYGIYFFEKGYDNYLNANTNEAKINFDKALELHLKSKSNQEIANDYNYLGILNITLGNYEFAENVFTKASSYYNLAKDAIGNQNVLYNLSEVYVKLGDFNNAALSLMKALKIAETIKDNEGVCDIYDQLGDLYSKQDEIDKAQYYFYKSLNLKQKINYSYSLATSYRSIGITYFKENDYKKSIEFIDKAFPFAQNKMQLAAINMTKGLILLKMKRYQESEKCLKQSLLDNETENTKSSIYPALSRIYFQLNKISEAEKYGLLGFEITQKNKFIDKQYDTSNSLYLIYKQKKQLEKSLNYLEIATKLNDSINKKENKNAVLKADFKYETEKKEATIKFLNQKSKIAELESKRKTSILLIFGLFFIGIATTVYVLFSRYKVRKKNELLENQLVESKKLLEAEKKVTESELKALKSQMNPHFIFNALNSIQSQFMMGDMEKANEQMSNFTYLTRQILDVSGKKQITIATETEILTKYLEIEKMRFAKDFEYKISVSKNINEDYHKIPPMLLQPLVENSIKHGLLHKKGIKNIRIKIDISEDETHLICSIEDNGIGRKKSAVIKAKNGINYNSFSTKALEERLELLNNKLKLNNLVVYEDILNAENEISGTKVILKVPLV